MKNLVICMNLDTLKEKNIYQFQALSRKGMAFRVFCYQQPDPLQKSPCMEVFLYPKNIARRILFIAEKLFQNRSKIHHAELYMGNGNFLFYEYALCRFFGIQVVVVERGTPLRNLCQRRGWIGRLVRKIIYKRTKNLWIRELWMKKKLAEMARSRYFFLPNAVPMPCRFSHRPDKPIDFLWCNSLKKWRNSDWFIDALCHAELASTKALLVGFLSGNPSVESQQKYALQHCRPGMRCLSFQPPEKFFLQAKYFVLPADIVYLNFALLEAMAHGVVPIISDVSGAREIVEDGENGFISAHHREGLLSALARAKAVRGAEYERLSKNARTRVAEKFSIQPWAEKLFNFYTSLESDPELASAKKTQRWTGPN